MAGVVGGGYPIDVDLDAPLEVARWRPWFAWVPALPHLVVLWLASYVMGLLVIVGWVVALVTGRLPDGLAGAFAWYQRYAWQVLSYAAGLREPYPAFAFDFGVDDRTGDPAVWVAAPPEPQSRLTVLLRVVLLIPHAFVLTFLYLGAMVAWFAGAVAVLVTGEWPEAVRTFLVGTARWSGRVNGYAYLLTDRYPPFALD